MSLVQRSSTWKSCAALTSWVVHLYKQAREVLKTWISTSDRGQLFIFHVSTELWEGKHANRVVPKRVHLRRFNESGGRFKPKFITCNKHCRNHPPWFHFLEVYVMRKEKALPQLASKFKDKRFLNKSYLFLQTVSQTENPFWVSVNDHRVFYTSQGRTN